MSRLLRFMLQHFFYRIWKVNLKKYNFDCTFDYHIVVFNYLKKKTIFHAAYLRCCFPTQEK